MQETEEVTRSVWSAAFINDLPDDAFAYIEKGGKKDEDGKTTPRSLRHLPYKGADGKVDEAHVRNALARLPQTQIPDAAKEAAKRKLVTAAKSVGIEVSDEEDRAMGADDNTSPQDETTGEQNYTSMQSPVIIRADGSHDPFKGKHSHSHPAFGSQGDDSTHEHSHDHDGDASHEHAHDDGERAAMPTHALLYAPIVRIDKEKREVEGIATSETVDSFGTIFSYEASKKAFQKWMEKTPNVREMHERKAAGKGIQVRFDDAARQIHVRSFVSRGAQDTWLKVEDGVLNGYSVGAIKPVWDTITRDGKKYPYLVSYELGELSLVDRASNPDAQGLVLCRADMLTDAVDITEENTPPALSPLVDPPLPVERAGARVSSSTRDAMHDSIKHTLHAARSQMQNCGCDTCCAAMSMIDPDGDGDIDIGGYDDPDNDADALYAHKNDGDMDRAITQALERTLPGVIERVLSPIYARQQQFLARMAALPEPQSSIPSIDTSALEERITTALVERVASASSLSEVRASLISQEKALEAVKETVERIEKQPMPGGPVLNGGYPVDKRLATQGAPTSPATDQSAMRAALDRLQAAGALNTIEAQTAAASLLIQPMPGRRG